MKHTIKGVAEIAFLSLKLLITTARIAVSQAWTTIQRQVPVLTNKGLAQLKQIKWKQVPAQTFALGQSAAARVRTLDLRWEATVLLVGVAFLQLMIPSAGLSGKVPNSSEELRSIAAPLPFTRVTEPKYGLPKIEAFSEEENKAAEEAKRAHEAAEEAKKIAAAPKAAPTRAPETTPAPAPAVGGKVVSTTRASASAYNSLPGQTDSDPFTTAAGTRTRLGIVAACYPFGTKVQIFLPGDTQPYKGMTFVVEDRMARKDCGRIDIWMPTYDEAIQFGRRNVEVRVLES